MKSLNILLFAAVATILAACTKDDGFSNASYESVKALEPVPVAFGTYMGGTPVTRAGFASNMKIDQLKANHFGVFAYHTPLNNAGEYLYWNTATSNTSSTPHAGHYTTASAANFMFNQEVSWDNTNSIWTYSPIKYWPNEFANGNVDNNGAYGYNNNGYVSFFAYAPYVDFSSDAVKGLTGTSPANADEYGITKINNYTVLATANQQTQDPILTYQLNSQYPVDLLWGTAATLLTDDNVNGTTQTGMYTTPKSGFVSKYPVNVNLSKQTTTGKINFAFKHALAGLGGGSGVSSGVGFQAVLDIDDDGALYGGTRETFDIGGGVNAWRTIVSIKNIEISNDLDEDGSISGGETFFNKKGTFNLATGEWIVTGSNDGSVFKQTIGTEGTGADAVLNSKIAELYNSTTTWLDHLKTNGLSEYFVKDNTTGGYDKPHPGVMETPINVYNLDTQSPLMFIPDPAVTKPKFRITVDYIVRTYDANLATEYTEVEQKISKVITFPAAFDVNQHYNIIMHLGLTGVKFTASVENWDESDQAGNDPSDDKDNRVDLPINVQ